MPDRPGRSGHGCLLPPRTKPERRAPRKPFHGARHRARASPLRLTPTDGSAMKAMIIGLLAVCALAIPGAGHAQNPPEVRQAGTGVVSGVVVAEDGAPINGATVAIKRGATGPVVGGRISD